MVYIHFFHVFHIVLGPEHKGVDLTSISCLKSVVWYSMKAILTDPNYVLNICVKFLSKGW